jgi:hypothetical protein
MKRYHYTCKLLSDVVISSVTATEGFNPSLDYIPGAKFLGIVASKLYDKQSATTLDLFYNGKVRFGDAFPQISGQAGLPIPFSWFFEKGKRLTEPPVYLHHKLENEDFNRLTKDGKQLKQARKGYFSATGQYLDIDQDFAIRSAYDRDELRAKDSQMFGYFSLPQGSTWTFTVEDDTEQYADEIKAALIGKKRIGRSRSAEYGLVDIQFDRELEIESKIIPTPDLTLIYALSNLCFYDSFGRSTLTPTPGQLGVPDGQIVWKKSQVRSRLYQTWNRYRHNRDGDRMIIEKGSVIAIKHDQPLDTSAFVGGIGSHRAEGFGKVLINPDFLLSKGITLDLVLTKANNLDEGEIAQTRIPSSQDSLVLKYLKQRKERKSKAFDLDKLLNEFVSTNASTFQGITPSQWGTIRAYAKYAPKWGELEKLLFQKDFGVLHRGQSEQDWRQKNRRGILQTFLTTQIQEPDRIAALLKLAAEMAKRKREKEAI